LEADDDDYYLSALDFEKEISFLDRSMDCCIGFVDIVNSTSNTAEMMMVSDDRRKKLGNTTQYSLIQWQSWQRTMVQR
jgi:hypothetical protein